MIIGTYRTSVPCPGCHHLVNVEVGIDADLRGVDPRNPNAAVVDIHVNKEKIRISPHTCPPPRGGGEPIPRAA